MSTEPIHSGHFMTSNPHSDIGDEDEDVEVDVVDVDDSTNASAAEKRNTQFKDEKPITFYKFGPHKAQSIAIDVSLNKLNKCIKVAYMKMTTPKWKDFKGLKLQWKHRIRLNNVIWRAYYMEFRKPDKRKKTPYCYFAVPDDDMTHTKSECSVLEGMYWKRRREGVCAQYKRWRTYNRQLKRRPRGCCRKRENSCGCEPSLRVDGLMLPPQSRTPQHLVSDDFYMDEDFDNVFTDRLFESLDGPFLFPNPKDSMQAGNADIMQPGLLSLQPSIEEIINIDYSLPGSANNDGLAAFIDRVSREPGDDSSVGTPQQQPLSQYIGSPATSTASRADFLCQQQPQQQKYLLAPADTNNNSNGDRDGTLARHFNSKSLNTGDSSSYTAKEYDAANMLINYSNQKNFSHSQHQQQLRSHFHGGGQLVVNDGGAPSKLAFARESSPLGTGTHMSLVQTHTPQPLYSQAFYSINDPLPVCTGSGSINQQRQFSSIDQIGTSTTTTAQQVVAPTTPVFQNLPQQQQQLLCVSTQQQQSHGQLQHNNNVFFSSAVSSSSTSDTSSSRLLPSSSSSAVLTLDQYVLAAAVAARSVSAAVTSSTATLNSLGVVNTAAPPLFNARATQQLLQQPQWWLQASTATTSAPPSSNALTPSYEGQPATLQFLRSAQILPDSNNTTQQQQQRHIGIQQQQPQQQIFFSSNRPTSTTTAVLSLLQSAQQQHQQERATSALPQLLQPTMSRPHDFLLISQSQPLQQPSPISSQMLSSTPASDATPVTTACNTTNDLSRYLPTNIGISSPSTVSTTSVSLPETYYVSPTTNVSTLQHSMMQHSMTGRELMNQLSGQCSTSVRYDSLATVQYNDNNTLDTQLDESDSTAHSSDATTILQFHQQCLQQQQQSQAGYEISAATTSSSKFESLQLPQQHSAGAFGQMQKNNKQPQQNKQQQMSQRQFSKPYPIKKFSQPISTINVGRPMLGVTPMTRPSSSDIYGMDEDSAPPNVKISRRSNLSESMSLDSMHDAKFSAQTQKTSRVGWMSDGSYSDATLSPSTPQPQQQHHQILSPQTMVGGTSSAFSSPTTSAGAGVSTPFTAPLVVPRQHQASAQISSTKGFLGIDSRDRNTSGVVGSLPISLVTPPFSTEPQNGSNFQQISSDQLQYTEMKNVSGQRAGKRNSSCTNTTQAGTMTSGVTMSATTTDTEHVFAASLSTLSAAAAAAAVSTDTKSTDNADSNGSSLHNSQFAGASVIDDGMSGMTTRVTDTDALTTYEGIPTVKEEQKERSSSRMSLQESFRQKTSIVSNRKQRGGGATAGNNASSSSVPADSTLHPEERKRILHLHAEKNRRSALKEGFDALVDVIPFVEQAGVKSTNAVVLNRAAAHIRELKTTSDERAAQVDALKQKIAQLNEKISLIQSNLPTTSRASSLAITTADGKGVPSMRSQIEQFFERYSKERSKRDYRFWLMSEIFAPIVRSYAAKVHIDASARDLVVESARQWLDCEWNATTLRPLASETLVRVATASGVFANNAPDALPKYILGEIAKLT